ncbi:unnamed protein product, partial [marine sediment metagenome]
MKRKGFSIVFALVLTVALTLLPAMPVLASEPVTEYYGDVTLSGGSQSGNFPEVWDLTADDELVLSFTYNANGLVDDSGCHAWAELGVREVGHSNFNPTWMVEGAGVWLATDYDWTANTFDPDPPSAPTLDLDDKLILQKAGGHGEGDYNLPSTPPNPWANHRIWFDRDGVDQWQGEDPSRPLVVDGRTYNTGGRYDIVITLQADSDTSGTAYMTVNGLSQGFETDGNWNTMELSPAGMTFTGDMTQMQVFYGLYGYGATHRVVFENITVTGCPGTLPMSKFHIDHAKIDFKKKADDDKVRVQGKLELDLVNGDGVDISDLVTVTVGPLSDTITMELKGKKGEKWEYKRPKGGTGDIKHMTINWKNGNFDIR